MQGVELSLIHICAMLRLGLPFDMEKQYAYARFSLSSGYEAMEYLLKHSPDIRCV